MLFERVLEGAGPRTTDVATDNNDDDDDDDVAPLVSLC